MSRIRDHTSEITSRRERLFKRKDSKTQVRERLDALDSAFQVARGLPKDTRNELLRYFPVGLVAVVEFFFRDEVRGFLDEGAAEVSLLRQFVDKVDVETAIDIELGRISTGEYVAHRLPMNNLNDVNQAMSKLMSEDFLGSLKAAVKNGQPVLQGNHVVSLKNLFNTRHIICHELATKHQVNPNDVTGHFEAVRRLFAATELKVYAEEITVKLF